MTGHEYLDLRALAMDRLIAEKIRRDPRLLDRAVQTLRHWLLASDRSVQPALAEWETLLRGPLRVARCFGRRGSAIGAAAPVQPLLRHPDSG